MDKRRVAALQSMALTLWGIKMPHVVLTDRDVLICPYDDALVPGKANSCSYRQERIELRRSALGIPWLEAFGYGPVTNTLAVKLREERE